MLDLYLTSLYWFGLLHFVIGNHVNISGKGQFEAGTNVYAKNWQDAIG